MGKTAALDVTVTVGQLVKREPRVTVVTPGLKACAVKLVCRDLAVRRVHKGQRGLRELRGQLDQPVSVELPGSPQSCAA
ncbi:hypothetical protein [Dietzia cinnamea]|uniref:hypothetical protein n=1 Tax=Dietzia cinnamea TaxID=321318 RepID=UPI00223C2B5A|nr:hypothetical protein [Dietzia cinnamea]MCT2219795.1 hypothetical protein [Dietzia cinnamea]